MFQQATTIPKLEKRDINNPFNLQLEITDTQALLLKPTNLAVKLVVLDLILSNLFMRIEDSTLLPKAWLTFNVLLRVLSLLLEPHMKQRHIIENNPLNSFPTTKSTDLISMMIL